MWRIVVLLVVAGCYSSAEQHLLTVVDLANVTVTETTTTGPGSRIIGGTPAPISRYPYAVQDRVAGQGSTGADLLSWEQEALVALFAQVRRNNQLICGGTLVTRRHVLSAAHCFFDELGRPLSAGVVSCRVGTATLNQGGAVHQVSMYINHERYNVGAARDNDISVLVLATTVTVSTAGVAAIPTQNSYVPDNAPVWVAGWGHTQINGQVSQVLNEAQVLIINNGICAQRYRNLELIQNQPFPVTYSMMCTGWLDIGGRDACQGDSGGPVVYNVNPATVAVVGVTSWGESCAHPFYPGVNARVSAYSNWINQTITRYNGAPPLCQASAVLLLISFLVSTMFSNKYC